MAVPRQEGSAESGRVNQKRRTRAAVVAAAKQLLDDGITPTVAEAAKAALVSRTTAYRYFPTQESLLLEVAVHTDVDDIEELVARPATLDGAPARAVEVLQRFNEHVLAEEVRYRMALRVYLDQWLTAVAAGDTSPVVREGRRHRWFAESLAPVRETVGAAELDRLVAALSLLAGTEAIAVLRDICQLDADDALAVTDWAARTLVDATLRR